MVGVDTVKKRGDMSSYIIKADADIEEALNQAGELQVRHFGIDRIKVLQYTVLNTIPAP